MGSREQVVATNLANAAQLRLASSYGVTSGEAEHLSRSAGRAERDVGKATRGLIAGSGAATGLGRSLAFASGGYLAFAGGADILRKSVDAARELARTQRQDATQLKAAGESWKSYRGEIEKTTLKLSGKSGFTNQALLQSFGFLVRSTGDATQALRLNAVAADVARGRNVSLQTAAIALGKAWGGDTASLKRLGVEVPKGVSGLTAINAVAAKFKGQARAGATEADRFNATLTDSEEIIGQGLLPVLNHYLGEFANWLQKMNESGRLQHDVNSGVHDAVDVFKLFAGIVRRVDELTGGFKHTLEILAAFKFARMVSGWSRGLNILTGAKGASGLLGAEEAAASLLGKLRALAGLGVIAVEVELFEYFIRKYGLKNTLKAGLIPGQTLGPGITPDQTITVQGKSYPIGSGAAFEALVKAGWKPPKGINADTATAAMEIAAAKRLGGSSSIPAPVTPDRTDRERRTRERQRHEREAARRAAEAAHAAAVLGTTTGNPRLAKIALEVQRADATGKERVILNAARDVVAKLEKLTPHLKGKDLASALRLETRERHVIAQAEMKNAEAAAKAAKAQQEAAAKQAAAADKLRSAAQSAVQAAQQQIGELFQGPVMNPSQQETLARLGVPGVTAKKLIQDVAAQNRDFREFIAGIRKLKREHIPAAALRELESQGVSALPEIQALEKASPAQRRELIKLLKQRDREEVQAATVILRTPKVSMLAQRVLIATGHSAAAHAGRHDGDTHVHVHVDGREVARATAPHHARHKRRHISSRGGRYAGN